MDILLTILLWIGIVIAVALGIAFIYGFITGILEKKEYQIPEATTHNYNESLELVDDEDYLDPFGRKMKYPGLFGAAYQGFTDTLRAALFAIKIIIKFFPVFFIIFIGYMEYKHDLISHLLK